MDTSESLFEESADGQHDVNKADLLNRVIARAIDLIIVVAVYEIIPKAGYLAAITYLLIADGLFQGRSAGKRIVGIKVIIRNSAGLNLACGFRESIIRNSPFAAGYILYGVLAAIPLIGWLLSVLVVAAIFVFEGLVLLGNQEGMRLGDELANTLVVQDKQGGLNV